MLQNRFKFTDRSINTLANEGYFWDTSLPKFGIYIGKRNKTFIALQGRNRKKLGHYPTTSLSDARTKAKAIFYGPQPKKAPEVKIKASEAITEYLSLIKIRTRTLNDYERLLNRHLLPTLGNYRLPSITATDILKITDALHHTPSEARHAHAAMQTFFNWCVPRHLKISPMYGLKSPAKPGKRFRILTSDEIKAVWHATSGYNLDHIIKICIATGMRRSEAAAIQPSWIKDNLLTIPAHISKNHQETDIPLTPLLADLITHAPFNRFNWARAKEAHDTSSSVQDYVLHDLRRTFRSKLSEWRCCDSDTAERLIGHKVGSDIQNIYDRWTYLPEKKEALEKYESHLRAILNIPTS